MNRRGFFDLLHMDPDCQKFFDIAGINTTREIQSICVLVAAKKFNLTWFFEDFIYTYSPSGVEQARYNLKDPDTFRLDYVGSPVHTTSGLQGNGLWYALTDYVPATEGLGIFLRWHYATSGILQQTFGCDWGAGTKGKGMFFRGAKTTVPITADYGIGTNANLTTGLNGVASYQRMNALFSFPDIHFWEGANIFEFAEQQPAEENLELLVMGFNNAGTPGLFSNARSTYWSLGNGVPPINDVSLINALHLDEYNNIQTYNATVIVGGR